MLSQLGDNTNINWLYNFNKEKCHSTDDDNSIFDLKL